jgi:hypothetical protein
MLKGSRDVATGREHTGSGVQTARRARIGLDGCRKRALKMTTVPYPSIAARPGAGADADMAALDFLCVFLCEVVPAGDMVLAPEAPDTVSVEPLALVAYSCLCRLDHQRLVRRPRPAHTHSL